MSMLVALVRMYFSFCRATCGQRYLTHFCSVRFMVLSVVWFMILLICSPVARKMQILRLAMSSRSLMTIPSLLAKFWRALTALSVLLMTRFGVALLSRHLFQIAASVL